MCDCSAEWAIGRPLRVDVDPLVVVGGIGEQVDPVLADLQPLSGTQLGTFGCDEFVGPSNSQGAAVPAYTVTGTVPAGYALPPRHQRTVATCGGRSHRSSGAFRDTQGVDHQHRR
jgi:hypothetical protein